MIVTRREEEEKMNEERHRERMKRVREKADWVRVREVARNEAVGGSGAGKQSNTHQRGDKPAREAQQAEAADDRGGRAAYGDACYCHPCSGGRSGRSRGVEGGAGSSPLSPSQRSMRI